MLFYSLNGMNQSDSVYELFPYPSRDISSKTALEKYGAWVCDCIGESPDWFRDKTVLELGCGTGEVAVALGLLGARVIAIDASKASIQKAVKLQERFGVGSVSFQQLDLFDFSSKERFDLVLSLGVLHHTRSPKKGFEIAVLHAKSGGLVVIGLYNSLGRLRLRLKRGIVGLLGGSDVKKRMKVASDLFYGGKLPEKGEVYLADKFSQPYESYNFVEEILGWFSKSGLDLKSSRPMLEKNLLKMQCKWFLEKRGAFFVLTGKKK